MFNAGSYYYDVADYHSAYIHLHEFYLRPNKELMQLLHSTGHVYFKQFRLFEDIHYRIDNAYDLMKSEVMIF